MKIIFNCDWDFFSPDWEKNHLNLIGNGALFRPLRPPKKIPDWAIIIWFMYFSNVMKMILD